MDYQFGYHQIEEKGNGDVVLKVKGEYQNVLFWIHGLSHQPYNNINIFQNKKIQQTLRNTKIVLLKAPTRYSTLLKRQTYSWYDIKDRSEYSFDQPFDQHFSKKEVYQSYQIIYKAIKEELEVVKDPKNIFIAGFSQGCAMSLFCLYQLPFKIGGVCGISGYLFPFAKYDAEHGVPVLLIYGDSDKARPWQFVKKTFNNRNIPVKFIQNMDHEYQPALQHFQTFIQKLLNKSKL